MQTKVKWNISKNLSLQQDVKKLMINNHFRHIWYGIKTYKHFPLVILEILRLINFMSFDLIECKLCFVGMNVIMG